VTCIPDSPFPIYYRFISHSERGRPPTRRFALTRSFAVRTFGVFAALFLASCFGDSTGLREARRAPLAFAPVFDSRALLVVDFERIRIHLVRPGTGELVLDTVVSFPSDADSIVLSLSVPVQGTSEDFVLTIAMISAAGDTVFRGGPTRVTAAAGVLTRAPAEIPAVYVGTGANAASVRFTAPLPPAVFFGDTVVVLAAAFDSAERAIAGTPVVYRIDARDTALARVPDPRVGHVVVKSVRGPARVIAELLTHQADTATLYVQPRPSAITVRGGAGQTGPVGAVLPQPLTVRVTAADSLGVQGVVVAFAVTTGGGSLSTSADTTDAGGDASVVWTLGSTPGSQLVTATAGSLAGLPLTIAATATPVPVASVAVSPATASLTVGATQQLTATPRDSAGATLTGRVVTWASSASGVAMVSSGGLVTAVAAGSATITATSEGISGTATVTVTAGVVSLSQSTVSVSAGTVASGGTVALQLQAKDANGNSLTTGGLAVVFAGSGGTSTGTIGATTDNANGTYTAIFTAGTAGTAKTIGATIDGAAVTSTLPTITVTPGAVSMSQSTVSVSAGTVAPGGTVTLTLQAKDASGNNLTTGGLTVVFAASGGTSTGTIGATTDSANGRYTATFTAGTAGTAKTIGATIGGTAVTSTLPTITVTATSSIVSTTVTPRLNTLTAIGATFTLVAQAKDAAGAPLAGHFTWVSRNPSAVAVDTVGVVKAVANGSAYVVATEAGGTKDSALIVVQQRIATIVVTPGTRSIYLTGRFAFTASAVDGGGTPIPIQPAFTWSSTAQAVASVDTAGNVTALGLGTTQIRATSGAIIGVSAVSVITPITRIAVVVDTVGAFKTDTFTLNSLGFTRRYRAIAHDTLDAVMTGVSFTWTSTNGSVAVLDSVTSLTAVATSAANGVTSIEAQAQGFTSAPGAFLTVAQVLSAIALTPPSATIAISGTVGLVARGLDANGRFISGGSFRYHSATPAVATVDSLTGVATGVALGTASITATSGAITSNVSAVTVSAQGPAIISFGRDTLSVGRGSNTSIPILLSRPLVGAPLIVKLTVADTFAYWSTPTVTIPSGATSINATLNGRNAGTTTVTATDSSGAGYSGATAVLAVTATMRLTSTGYSINATDIVSTQVLLSDPSPAGGTYVTFSYGTAGIAAISPDPAFVPAGQLAADIQIRGIGAGTTTITPVAIGVSGTASSFTAYAAVLTISQTSLRLGQGQYSPDVYVQAPTYTHASLPVSLASSDTNVVTVPATATILAGSYYVSFTTTARATGTATISVSAPGWTSARTMAVTVTTPAVGLYGGGSLYTTSPAQNVTVYAEDSMGTAHYRVNSLVVHLASRDTTVMKVLDTVVTIGPGQYYTSAGRVIPGGLGGSTYVVATASGHAPDSVQFTVLGPPLALSWSTNRIGVGQEDYSLYVSTPNAVTAPLVVTLANTDSSIVGAPTSVTILTGTYYTYFTVRGKTPGGVTLRATAPGYQPDSASYLVTSPRLTAYGGGTVNNFSSGGTVTVYAADSVRTTHYRGSPLTVSIVSTDTNIVKVDSATVRIDSGSYGDSHAHFTPVAVGTARIIVTASGHLSLDTLTVTVVTPKIQFSIYSALVGRRQYFSSNGNGFYIHTPDNRTSPLAATITQKHGTVDSLTTTAPTIPTASYYVYLDAYGLANGTDTLIVTAPGYLPDTAFVTVSSPRLTNSGMPGSATTTNAPLGINVYAADSAANAHYAMDTVVVAAVSSDTTVIRPVQRFFRILKGAYYAQTTVSVVGPGTASITYSDSAGTGYLPTTTNTITVTGPSLTLSNNTGTLGMRQTGGANSAYVSTPNNVTSPLVVRLLSTGTRVVTVPDSVVVATGAYYAYFPVTAMDTVGTIQVQATALGYGAAAMNVQVTAPQFVLSTSTQLNTTSGPRSLTVYAADANGFSHAVTENVTATLLSSSPSVASIDSSMVTILAGSSSNSLARWSPGQVGTAQLSASDGRAVQYKYNADTVTVTVVQPTLAFSWGGTLQLGIGQYDNQYVYAPDNQAAPLSVALAHSATPRTSITVGGTAVTGVTIPSGTNSASFHVVGTSAGNDTLVASATSPAHNPDAAYVLVAPGRVDPLSGWPTSIRVADSVLVTLYSRDAATSTHYVAAATTFTLAPNANIQFVSGGVSSAVITSVTIPADAYYVQFYLKGQAAGTGSVTITQANYQSYTPTVTVSP
jgi:uncharacterized protein YjdB